MGFCFPPAGLKETHWLSSHKGDADSCTTSIQLRVVLHRVPWSSGETRLHCEAFNAALQCNARREAILPWNTFEIMRLLHVFLSLPESFRKLLLIFVSIHEYLWLRLFCNAQTQTSISQFRDRLDFYTWNRQNLYIVCWNVQHSEISGWLCTAAERAPRGVPCCWINQQVNQAWT